MFGKVATGSTSSSSPPARAITAFGKSATSFPEAYFSDVSTNLGDKTKSHGISPRVILSYEPNRNFSINLQAAKGFRLGGINDPLNVPLCTAADLAIFGGQGAYKDETLWNYEAGVKYSKHGITFNSAVFHNEIRNLQVTQTAGSCSSRVVFNVPKAHRPASKPSFRCTRSPVWTCRFPETSRALSSIRPCLPAPAMSSAGSKRAIGCRPYPSSRSPPPRPMASGSTRPPSGSITASVQHIGNRFGEPADQVPGAGLVGNAIFFDPTNGEFG